MKMLDSVKDLFGVGPRAKAVDRAIADRKRLRNAELRRELCRNAELRQLIEARIGIPPNKETS